MTETSPTPAPEAVPETTTEAVSLVGSASPAEPSPETSVEASVEAAAPSTEAGAETGVAALTPAEVGAKLKSLFPALFSGGYKPLKLRVQADIQERAPGQFSKAQLSGFLRKHTGSTGYLIASGKATHRFDLDGQPVEALSDEHRKVAQEELTRRRGLQREREELAEQQYWNRANLLRDYERTTLTVANFCALKGVTEAELPGLLDIARQEATTRPPEPERRAPRPDQRPDPRREPRRDDRPRHKPGSKPQSR